MKVFHRYLRWDNDPNTINRIKNILDLFKIKYKYEEGTESIVSDVEYCIEFHLHENHQDFLAVKSKLQGIIDEDWVATEYEKNDFQNAEWFIISTGSYQYPQPEDNYIEKTFDTSNYCEICGIGKTQNNPFYLKHLPKQKRNQFWGLHWEYEPIFVRKEAKKIIKSKNIKGVEFSNPVLHRKNLKIDDFCQLHLKKVLPIGFDYYNSKIITCKLNNEEKCNKDIKLHYCGRIKYHHPMIGGYFFNKEIFDSNYDIALTAEYFGSGASANRLTICSKKFKNIVEKNKLKGLQFTPIMHEKFERKSI